jgi:CDP-diacylglycerol--glycerol-3-phosphate 3-phosphatidyltransferase
LGVTHDERVTVGLFSMPSPAQLDVATGYMNLTDEYSDALLHRSSNPVRILAAAVDANGWYGAKGGGRYVPDLYAACALELLQRTEAAGQSQRVQLLEWSKPGWSYHAKGAWLTPLTQAAGGLASGPPLLSLIGSPNFGARSAQRDSESSVVLLTKPNSPLAHALAQEKQRLLEHCKRVTLAGEAQAAEDAAAAAAKGTVGAKNSFPVEAAVRPPLWLRMLSKLARPYM